MVVNHKRVARIMREDNLLAVQPRAFVVTTDSDHELEVYLNLASRMKLTGINQLWVADITYIRLKNEFVYLAVILDALFAQGGRLGAGSNAGGATGDRGAGTMRSPNDSRRQVWCITPIVACSTPPATTSGSCEKHQMIPSMSRPANPYDNASCESFMKTLKREEIYANQYRDLDHLRANIEEFIEQYYNSLPVAFGAGLSSAGGVRAGCAPANNFAGSDDEFFQA